MRIQIHPMRCGDCAHVWQGELLLECEIARAVQVMRRVHCPMCRSRKVVLLCGEQAVQAQAQMSQQEEQVP